MVAESRLRLHLITPSDAHRREDYLAGAEAALEGGVSAVQLRLKGVPTKEVVAFGRELAPVVKAAGALFVVNDRFDLARVLDADAVHLGADDLSVATVRVLAPNLVIGATVRTPEGAREALDAGADYLGVGAVFASPSKDSVPVIGLHGLGRVVEVARGCPVVAIGGIGEANAKLASLTGASGVAAIGALARGAPAQMRQAAGKLRAAVAAGLREAACE